MLSGGILWTAFSSFALLPCYPDVPILGTTNVWLLLVSWLAKSMVSCRPIFQHQSSAIGKQLKSDDLQLADTGVISHFEPL